MRILLVANNSHNLGKVHPRYTESLQVRRASGRCSLAALQGRTVDTRNPSSKAAWLRAVSDHRQRQWRDGLPCDSAGHHATMGPWDCSRVFALRLSPPCRDGPCVTAARASARIDLPTPPSLRPWLCLHLRQHTEHERQQLVQGVELCHLVGGQMLDAAAPRRRPTGPRAKLDHKGLIARECRLGWDHASLPYAYVRLHGVVPYLACAWRRV